MLTIDTFQAIRHQLPWLGQTRPDIVSIATIPSEVTEAMFSRPHIKLLNAAVRRAPSFQNRGLTVLRLREQALRIAFVADGHIPNNSDLSAQLGFCVFLCDDTDNRNCLHFTST